MPGTVLKQLVQTPLADNTAITTANSGFNGAGGSAGTGNAAVFLDAAKMSEAVGYRLTQAGANQNNWYVDLTSAVAVFSARIPFSYAATPTANVAFLRLFPDTGHATNLGGFLFTTTNRLQFVEGSGTTPLNISSPVGTPLVPGSAYILQLLVNITADTLEAQVYARASTTPLFTISGSLGGIMAAAAGIQSARWGISTASALTQLNTNNAFALGSGDYLARTDVSNTAPTAGAGLDIAVEAGQPFILTGTDLDVDGAVVTRSWSLAGASVGSGASLSQTAPVVLADASRTYTYTVTDNQGATASDAVTVTCLAATRRIRSAGAVQASVRRIVTA